MTLLEKRKAAENKVFDRALDMGTIFYRESHFMAAREAVTMVAAFNRNGNIVEAFNAAQLNFRRINDSLQTHSRYDDSKYEAACRAFIEACVEANQAFNEWANRMSLTQTPHTNTHAHPCH